jgi:GH15 family glucan-1,4-alpha-glucosidase
MSLHTGERQPAAIGDYGLIGDCHGCALVSREGSIDWCCLPRIDSGSCFGRLLDYERGGACWIELAGEAPVASRSAYEGDTLVLGTQLEGPEQSARTFDFFAMPDPGAAQLEQPVRELVRVIDGVHGTADVAVRIAPRFDYGAARPWFRRRAADAFTAIAGDDGLLIWSDRAMRVDGDTLVTDATLRPGERLRVLLRFISPHWLEHERHLDIPDPAGVDARLQRTLAWWRQWRKRLRTDGLQDPSVVRSAIALKALAYEPTGAIAAAATASLPEAIGAGRNWDYRFSWIRDSVMAAHALAELGCEQEAARFRHFIVRTAGGHAEDLQVLFGIGGERRILEQELDLRGYRDSRPVRVGNAAASQLQLDAYGELLGLGWRWHRRGHEPDDEEWRFFAELVDAAIACWRQPDRGIWEWRGRPRHFTHSKAACWVAVDRGLRLAEECMRKAPTRRWQAARTQIRSEIERRGYDERRGVFTQCFDSPALDAALLTLPLLGFLDYEDERMVRTADAVREQLDLDGFLRRYEGDDDLKGKEAAFLACSFWLAECYARQGRPGDAQEVYDRALSAAGPLGLFSEQYDPRNGERLGNYPQALTHLSHIAAAVAMAAGGPHTLTDLEKAA